MAFADVWKEQIFPVIQDDYAAMLQMVPLRVLAASVKKREKGESRTKNKTKIRRTRETTWRTKKRRR